MDFKLTDQILVYNVSRVLKYLSVTTKHSLVYGDQKVSLDAQKGIVMYRIYGDKTLCIKENATFADLAKFVYKLQANRTLMLDISEVVMYSEARER